jgi:hypothetical protein
MRGDAGHVEYRGGRSVVEFEFAAGIPADSAVTG